jgi:RNA polymerase sigma factor (sigma-70 family)
VLSQHPPSAAPGPVGVDNVTSAYFLHAAELHRFAMSRGASMTADDLVQEAFLRLSVQAGAGRYPSQPRAWLYRVVMNLIISAARRRITAKAAIDLKTIDVAEPVDLETPEARCLAAERHQRIGDAMASVSSPARTGLQMAADGYSGREIALAIGRSEVATRALLCRARGTVRRSLLRTEMA